MQSIQLPVTQVGLEQSIQQALKTAGRNAQINLGTNSRQINALAQPLGRITGQADEFTKSMEAANARVFAFGASVGVINGVSKAFQALVKNTIATEKALTDININLKQSSSELDKFGNNLFNLAKSTGQSFETVADGALELSRQGLDAEKVLKRLNDALILSRLSGLDAQQSVEGLTAAVNSFAEAGITSEQIVNKLVVVSQKYAVSERDLIEGIKRSASVADQAGVSFDELVGVITTVQERTARGGAVIGNAFKTIFAKIQDKGALEDLQNLGVQVTDTAGKILPATSILQNLAKEFEGLSQTQQTDIAKKLGGVYQLSNLLAAVKDLGSEQSKYADIVKLSQGATSEAYKKNAALNETLSAIINKVSISAEQLGATLGKIGITDNLRDLLNFFGGLLDSIQNILGEESAMGGFVRGLVKGIGNLISGPGLALFGAIIVKLSKDLVQFGFSSLKSFFGIGKAAKEVADVEKAINTALATNIGLQQKLFSLEGNRAGQLKVITDALIQQEAVIRRSAAISKDLASPSYGLGIRATGQGLRVPEKNAAAGYMPAVAKESSDISRGVGGARSGDKPVVIPNFNFGGGKKGSIVAHTGEYAIPNFAGSGGTAIFNRDMVKKMGLPAGAKKIGAAGGLIPNFAAASRDLFVDRVGLSGKTVKGEWNAFKSDNPNLNIGDKENAYSSLGNETIREAYLNWRSSGEKSLQRRIKEEESIKLMQGDYSSNIALLYPSSKQKTGFATTKGGNVIKIASVVSHPDDFLYKELRQSFINTSRNYVKNIGINPDVVDDQKFLDIANKTLNEGTLQSAVGNVFETALQAASGIQSKKSNSNFDILGEGSIKGFAASFGSANGLQPNSHLSNVLNKVKALDFKNALNNDNINSFDTKIKNAIQMGEIKTPKLENKASGYIPNYVSKSREIGRGVQGAFYRLGEKDGTQVGVKKFFKDGPSKAVEFEWLVSEFINKYANIPSIFGPKNLSSLEDSKRKLSIRKEVISDPLAKTALGSQVSESFGRRVLFSALGARGLSIEDLHGSNYTVNKNAENQIDQLRNYPQNAVGAFATLRSMAAAGAKIGILDPGAAKVSGIARDIIGKILIKQTQQKTAANGYIPNFANKYTKKIGEGWESNVYLSDKGKSISKVFKDRGERAESTGEAITNEWKIGKYINEKLGIAGITGPKILSDLYDSVMQGSIKKQFISDPIASKSLGRNANVLGLEYLRKMIRQKSNLDLPDLHGDNFTINTAAKNNFTSLKGKSPKSINDITSNGGKINIIDPGFAEILGNPAERQIDLILEMGEERFAEKNKKRLKEESVKEAKEKAAILEKQKKLGNIFKVENSPYNNMMANFQTEHFKSQAGGAIFTLTTPRQMYMDDIRSESSKDKKDLIKYIVELAKARNLPLMAKDHISKGDKSILESLNKSGIKLAPLTSKYAARGFLPNFADPLKQAIGREMAAGVPSSQIYIDKSPSLKSAANPMGLMVANRRDEPMGGYQGVSRAIKEGRNPKTYGAAGGFVPNYASIPATPTIGKTGNANFDKALNQFAIELEKGSKTIEEVVIELGKLNPNAKKLTPAAQALAQKYSEELSQRQQAIAARILESKAGKKLASQLDKIYLEYNKSQKTTQDLQNAQAKTAAILNKTSLSKNSQTAIVRSTQSLAANRQSAQVGASGSKDMLGTIFALQGAMSVLSGYTDDLSGSFKVVAKSITDLGSGLATAGFAYQGASQLAKDAKSSFGKFLGNVGMAGAVIMGAFEVFKLGKSLYYEFSGANERAAKSALVLASAAEKAALSLDSYGAEQKDALKKTSEDIFKNLDIRGITDPEAQSIKDSILQALGAGASRKSISEAIIKSTLSKTETVRKNSSAQNYNVGDFETTTYRTLNNGDLEGVARSLGALSESPDIKDLVKLKGYISEGMSPQDIGSIKGQFSDAGKMQSIAELLKDPQAIQESLKQLNQLDNKGNVPNPSELTKKLEGLIINRPTEILFLKEFDKIQKDKAESEAKNSSQRERDFKINMSQFAAELQFEKKMKDFRTGSFLLEADQRKQIADIENDLSLNEDERAKKIALINTYYQTSNSALKAQEESIKNINDAVSQSLSKGIVGIDAGQIPQISESINQAISNEQINLISLLDKGNIDEFQKQIRDIIKKSVGQDGSDAVPEIFTALVPALAKALKENENLTDKQKEQIELANIQLSIDNKKIDSARERAQLEAKIAATIQSVQQSEKFKLEYNSLEIAKQSLSINQEIEKIKNDTSLSEYERAKQILELEKQKKQISSQSIDISAAQKQLDISQNLRNKARSEVQSSSVLSPSEKTSLLQNPNATAEQLLQGLNNKDAVAAANVSNAIEDAKNQLKLLGLETEHSKSALEDYGKSAEEILIQNKEGGLFKGINDGLTQMKNTSDMFAFNLGEKLPQMFSDKMAEAMSQLIEGGKSFGEVMKNVAYEFLKDINSQLLSNLASSFTQSIGGGFTSLFRASGGAIVGGSGNKDDVPAMLMGGEFVMNKKAVQKYGPDFLNALNSGSISGYAKGGPVQKGPQGNFYTPGQYGLGAISGSKNLLGFATQSYTTGKRDEIINSGNYGSINLEAESGRLTNFGRQNSPAAEALRSAKGEAFSLYLRDYEAKKEAQKQSKERDKALKNQLIMAGISIVGGSLIKSAATGFGNAYNASSNTGVSRLLDAGKGIWSGYEGAGGLSNIFSQNAFTQYGGKATIIPESGRSMSSVSDGSSSGKFNASAYGLASIDPTTAYDQRQADLGNPAYKGFSQTIGASGRILQAGYSVASNYFPLGSILNINGREYSVDDRGGMSNNIIDFYSGGDKQMYNRFANMGSINVSRLRATGGAIPSTSGIDTVSTMLSGGEFIMNRAAAQNIGSGNLQALNSGARSLPTEEKSEELNDRLISKLDELIEASGSAGNITINVEGGSGKSSETSDGNGSEGKQQLARQIRDAVLKVIQEEKRLGGQLRRGM